MNKLFHIAHVVGAYLLASHHRDAGIDSNHVPWIIGLQGLSMLLTEFPGLRAKLQSWLGAASKAVGCLLAVVLALAVGGCSLTPQQIETDTAIAVSVGLQGATVFDKAKADEIKKDAVEVAKAINAVVLPTFQPGATSGVLLSSTVNQVVPHLQARLAGLKHGSEILGIITLLQGPLSSALGATAAPTAALSPSAQMNALGFFSGVSQGISAFTGDPTLAPPPLPSVPVVPPPQAAPAPSPQK